jgi:hypothetical protein
MLNSISEPKDDFRNIKNRSISKANLQPSYNLGTASNSNHTNLFATRNNSLGVNYNNLSQQSLVNKKSHNYLDPPLSTDTRRILDKYQYNQELNTSLTMRQHPNYSYLNTEGVRRFNTSQERILTTDRKRCLSQDIGSKLIQQDQNTSHTRLPLAEPSGLQSRDVSVKKIHLDEDRINNNRSIRGDSTDRLIDL